MQETEQRCDRIAICQRELIENLKQIKDRVQDAIDKGTTAVEKVHQDILHKPIEVLESIAPNLPLTDDALVALPVEEEAHRRDEPVRDWLRRWAGDADEPHRHQPDPRSEGYGC